MGVGRRLYVSISIAAAFTLSGCDVAPSANKQSTNSSSEKVATPDSNGQSVETESKVGPFGIAMGQSIGELKARETQAGWYELTSIPRPHRMFPKVVVQATKTQGVCFVKGIGPTFSSDSNGLAALNEADKIKRQLDSKYGQPREISFLVTGSIWDEPEDWMMAMLKGERRQAWDWAGPSSQLDRQSLNNVGLGITVESTSEASLYVEYYFKNSQKCDEELEALEASAL